MNKVIPVIVIGAGILGIAASSVLFENDNMKVKVEVLLMIKQIGVYIVKI